MPKEYHFLKEIRQQPEAIRKSLEHADPQLHELARRYAGQVKRVILVGCGDPYLLGLAAVYAFERWAGLPAESIEAAEFAMYRHQQINQHTLIVLITSSGKTVKVIDAARLAAQRGAPAFALTNLNPSPITAETDQVIQTQAGWSDSFPTKQTTTALAVLYALALHWAAATGAMPAAEIAALRQALYVGVPQAAEQALALAPQMEQLAQQHLAAPIYSFIGSGPNWATALLAAAKLKETSQSRSEATNLEEYAHLHSLSITANDPVVVITAPGQIGERSRLICQHITSNGGRLAVVGPAQERELWAELEVAYCQVADHDEMFGPLVAWVPLQLFAYYVALGKGRNPDRPPERGPMDFLQKIIYTSMLEGWFER